MTEIETTINDAIEGGWNNDMLKVGDVKIIKPNIDSSQDTLNELLLTLVDAVNELNGHTPVKPEKTLEEKFDDYYDENLSWNTRDLAQIAEEHYKELSK